jgi:hypothetical protein
MILLFFIAHKTKATVLYASANLSSLPVIRLHEKCSATKIKKTKDNRVDSIISKFLFFFIEGSWVFDHVKRHGATIINATFKSVFNRIDMFAFVGKNFALSVHSNSAVNKKQSSNKNNFFHNESFLGCGV